jgi:hypothetical protein
MRVFLVTGAGVSAESGLGTFRDKGGTGIWTRFDPMKLATPEAFVRDPQEVYAFYNARRRNLITAKPNAAHFALARLETALAERGGNLTLVTQNPDGRYIVTFDGSIDGNLIQIAILVTENARERWKASTCSRPWPVVKLFRQFMGGSFRDDRGGGGGAGLTGATVTGKWSTSPQIKPSRDSSSDASLPLRPRNGRMSKPALGSPDQALWDSIVGAWDRLRPTCHATARDHGSSREAL